MKQQDYYKQQNWDDDLEESIPEDEELEGSEVGISVSKILSESWGWLAFMISFKFYAYMYIEFVLEHCFSIDESDKQFDDVLTATRV